MIKAEQIPDEAYEAASRVEDKNDVSAVILAAINAWPHAIINEPDSGTFVCRYGIILPPAAGGQR